MRRTVTWLAATAVAVGLLAVPAGAGDGGPPAVPELGGSTASLSEPGRELVRDADLGDAPRYALRADVDPESGRVRGELHASLPSSARGHLVFRMFPGLPELDTKLEVTDVRVDGQRVDAEVDAARLLLPAPRGGGGDDDGRVDVRLSFSYVVPKIEPSFNPFDVGDTLDPSAIGLLGRHDDLASLGHWFPVWLPPGSVDEADPSGFGDIGNFPAAVINAQVRVPRGWTVVTGGVSTGRERGEGGVTYTEEGVGLRDLSIVVGRGLVSQETEVDGITIRVTGGRDARDQLEGIAKEAGDSLTRFSDTFAPYPWRELDVLAVPLGSQVAGMEWPGMVWIESSLFGGGFPGLGDLEDLLEDLPGSESGASTFGDLEELFESLPGFADTRRFTVAHEVAHEWWHALVGNDSIASPVMDEPLAQYSACLDLRGGPSGSGGTPAPDLDPCVAHIDAQYQGMRSFGMEDAPAEQPTDAFASGLQYGGVIYGKAPGFYRALEQLIGPEAVAAGLREYATSYAFKEAGPDELLAAFAAQVPERRAEIDALWIRWMREAHGDEDLGTTSASGVPGLEGNGFEQLQELLERLFGEGGPGDIPDATEPTPTTQLA